MSLILGCAGVAINLFSNSKKKNDCWCERGDSNPHGGYPPDPKSGASANSATFASRSGLVYDICSDRRGGFARGIEEGKRLDCAADFVADGLDGDLDLEIGIHLRVLAGEAGEGNHLFEQR